MKKEPEFRSCQNKDIPKICEIAVNAWAPIYAAYRKDMGADLFKIVHADWKIIKAQNIRKKAEKSPNEVFVSILDGKIAGFTTFSLDSVKRIGEIGNNAVDPEFQGSGIGTFQHRKVLEIFEKEGMRYAIVTTGLDDGHAKARKSYEKAGFERMSWYINYYLKLD